MNRTVFNQPTSSESGKIIVFQRPLFNQRFNIPVFRSSNRNPRRRREKTRSGKDFHAPAGDLGIRWKSRMERRGPREEEGNTGNKKALPGTRMGSAGRTGRRNKRFGDKKWGSWSDARREPRKRKWASREPKARPGDPTCEAAACYSPTPSRVQYHRRAWP